MAEAFFRFGTNIKEAEAEIRAGLSGIGRDLARARGGKLNIFDDLARSAAEATRKANAELAKLGETLSRVAIPSRPTPSASGRGDELAAEAKRVRSGAVSEVTKAGRAAGLSATEIKRLNDQVRESIDKTFKHIASELASDRNLKLTPYLRGEAGAKAGVVPSRLLAPSAGLRELATIEKTPAKLRSVEEARRAGRLRAQEQVPEGRAKVSVANYDRQEREDKAARDKTQRALDKQAREAERAASAEERIARRTEQEASRLQARLARKEASLFTGATSAGKSQVRTAARETDRANTATRQGVLYDQIANNPRAIRTPSGYVLGSAAFNVRGAGLSEETNPAKVAKAVETAVQAQKQAQQRTSLGQSFLGGLTSSGFGGRATGIDTTGIARSFGSTVKFTAQYQALNLVTGAFSDVITEAVDYRDSLTDLNVALGQGNEASSEYVDKLSDISRAAGGNVGQALDAAARGVRAFTKATDSDQTKERAGELTAQTARNLSIITGQTIPDATGDLVAVGQSFGIAIEDAGRVADAVAAAKTTGGDPNQILQGLANAAVALQAAGFSATDGAFLIGSVIANLNESGQAAATRISRIVSAASSTSGRELFRTVGIDPNQDAKQSLLQLASKQATGQLSEADLQRSLNTLGGGSNLREFKASLDALTNNNEGFAKGFDTAGKASAEADRKINDLAGTIKQLAGTLANVENEIFDSGLFAPFLAALKTLEPTLKSVEVVLKSFNSIVGVFGNGFQQVGVGIVELVVAYRVLSRVRAKAAQEDTVLIALENDLAVAKARVAEASAVESTTEGTALRAHQAAVVGLEAQIAAHNGLAAAKVRSAEASGAEIAAERAGAVTVLPAPGRVARARTVAAGKASAGFTSVVSSTVGKAFVAGAVITTAIQVMQGLTDAVKKNTESRKTADEGLATLTSSSTPGSSVEALEASGQARREAGSGFFGNIGNFFSSKQSELGVSQTIGVDSEKDRRAFEQEAKTDRERRDVREREAKRRANSTGRFDDILGDVTSLDSIKSGFDQLNAGGASAGRQMKIVADALKDLGTTPVPGSIKAGSLQRITDSVTGGLFDSVSTGVARELDADRVAKLQSSKEIERRVDGRIKAQNEERRNKSQADGSEPLPDLDVKDPAVRAAARQKVVFDLQRKAADVLLNKRLEGFGVGNRGEIQERTGKVFQDYVNEVLPGGKGVLSPQQLDEAARRVADSFIGDNKRLGRDRESITKAVRENIVARTSPAKDKTPQEVSDLLQQQGVAAAAQIGQDQSDLEGDRVGGARARIAQLEATIDQARRGSAQVNDSTLADLKRAQRELVGLVAARADSYDELAKSLLGDDDALARGAIDIRVATRDLAAAQQSGVVEDINAAQVNLNAQYRAQAKNRLELANAQTSAGVRPGDAVAEARAAVTNASRTRDTLTAGSAQYVQATTELTGLNRAVISAQVDQTNALASAAVRPGDAVGSASAELANARRRLGTVDQFGNDGQQTAEFSNLFAEVQKDVRSLVDARIDQLSALAGAVTSPLDVVGQAINELRTAQAQLANTPRLGTDGRQTAEYSNRLAAERRARSSAQAAVDRQANQVEAGAVREADTFGKARVAVRAAQRDLNRARAGGADAGSIAELEDNLEKAVNARLEANYAVAEALLRAQRSPLDEIGRLQDDVRVALGAAQRGRTTGVDAGQQATLDRAAVDAQLALRQGLIQAQQQQRLATIDPRDSVARAREVSRQAQQQVEELKRAGATGVAVSQALAALTEARIAQLEAELADRAQNRRGRIDLTNPLAEARAATQDAQDRLRSNRAARAPKTVQDKDLLDLRAAQNNEEQVAFSQRLSQVQTNERLGRTSHAAYIAYLNGEKTRLESIAHRTFQQQEQLNTIDEALKASAESLSGQFNLGDIKVPTVYEVRRSIAAETAGRTAGQAAAASTTNSLTNVYINGADLVEVKRVITALVGPAAISRTPVAAGRKVSG